MVWPEPFSSVRPPPLATMPLPPLPFMFRVPVTLIAPPVTGAPFRFRVDPAPACRVAPVADPWNSSTPPFTASTVPPVNTPEVVTFAKPPLALIVPPPLPMSPVVRFRVAWLVAMIRPPLVREVGATYSGELWLALIVPLLFSAKANPGGAMYPEPWMVWPEPFSNVRPPPLATMPLPPPFMLRVPEPPRVTVPPELPTNSRVVCDPVEPRLMTPLFV